MDKLKGELILWRKLEYTISSTLPFLYPIMTSSLFLPFPLFMDYTCLLLK